MKSVSITFLYPRKHITIIHIYCQDRSFKGTIQSYTSRSVAPSPTITTVLYPWFWTQRKKVSKVVRSKKCNQKLYSLTRPVLFVALLLLYPHCVKWALWDQNQHTPRKFQIAVGLQWCFQQEYQAQMPQAVIKANRKLMSALWII